MSMQPLPWDSEFFERSVARLNVNNEHSVDFLKKEFLGTEKSVFDVCYIYVYHDSDEITAFLLSTGAVLYDHKVTFSKKLSEEQSSDSDIVVAELKNLTQDAIDIAVSSGIYSRFYRDPHFRNKQPLLYKKWISNCFDHRDGKVFGIVENDVLAAIAGVSVFDGKGHLELIAVDSKYRRRGFAKALIHTAEKFYMDSGASTSEVVTQLDNTSACATYRSCGYEMTEKVDVWHLWKNDSKLNYIKSKRG